MKRSTKVLLSLGVSSTLVLSACSQPVLEVPDPQSEAQSGSQSGAQSGSSEEDLALTLTEDQVSRIVADIQADLDTSVAENDPSVLEQRVVDPALTLRKGQFIRAEKTDTAVTPLTITQEVFSATVGDSWPRVLLVASNASGDQPAAGILRSGTCCRAVFMKSIQMGWAAPPPNSARPRPRWWLSKPIQEVATRFGV